MKQFCKLAVCSAAMVTLMGFSVLAAPGGQAIAVGATTGSSLNLRSTASTDGTVLTMLDKYVAVAILDDTNPDWYQVSYKGNTGYVSSAYLIVDQDGLFTTYGTISQDAVTVHSDASGTSTALATVDADTPITVNGFTNGWYQVTCQYGTEGYIRSDYVDLRATPATSNADVVDTAKQYLGIRYSYGGSSPSGFDCSGFTMYVYQQHGISLPHSATSQWTSGLGSKVYAVSALSAGDLVFFCDPSVAKGKACSHVGIYIGDGTFIHSSSSAGISISSLTSGYWSSYYIGGLHI